MTRKELLGELSRCAGLYGYPFKTGLAYRINAELASPAIVWAEPPQLTAKTGRAEGTKHYRITLRAIRTHVDSAGRDEALDGMEEVLCGIISTLEQHEKVIKTTSLEYTTEEGTLTNKGELSVKAVFTLITRF